MNFWHTQTSCPKPKLNLPLAKFIADLEIQLQVNSNFEAVIFNNHQHWQNLNANDYIDSTLKFFYHSPHHIQFSPERNQIHSILPSSILKNQNASCLGMALLLYLQMQMYFHHQVHLELLPNHIIVSLDQDQSLGKRYFEPNRQGFSYSLNEYLFKYQNQKWTSQELKPLSEPQIKAILLFQVANAQLIQHQKKFLHLYPYANDLFPEYQPIQENWNFWKSQQKKNPL